jgi:hypothetical protein
MKTKLKLLPLLLLSLALCLLLPQPAKAQTSSNFLGSIQSYFTSFNTNYTWTNVVLEVGTGYKQVTGVNAASTLDIQYDLGRFNLGGALQFSGVGSPINAAEGQVGYTLLQRYDAKLDFDIRGGYDDTVASGVVEPCLFIKKKGTANTYFETGVSLPIYFKQKLNTNPTFFIQTGFTL